MQFLSLAILFAIIPLASTSSTPMPIGDYCIPDGTFENQLCAKPLTGCICV